MNILSNDFEAVTAVNAAASQCAADAVEVTFNQTTEHRDIQMAALTANPAEYTVAVVANGSIVALLNEGLVRSLDDLVAAHGASLSPNQLITVDGKVMAVAFMSNAQHLFVRQDILDAAGVPAPTT